MLFMVSYSSRNKKQHFRIIDFGKDFLKLFIIKSIQVKFSKFRESMGFVIAYAYSNFLCVRIKLFLLIFYLAVGIIGYGTIEFRLKNKKNKVSITSF